jgi:predicted DNA-binding protein
MSASSKPVPLAIPNALLDKINLVVEKTGRSKAEVMRLAMEAGLDHLKRIKYAVGEAIVDKSERTKMLNNGTILTEDAADYGADQIGLRKKRDKGKK